MLQAKIGFSSTWFLGVTEQSEQREICHLTMGLEKYPSLFCRWGECGVEEKYLNSFLVFEPGFDHPMIDGSHITLHPRCRVQGSNPYRTHKRGINSKINLAADAHGMLVRMFITANPVEDYSLLADVSRERCWVSFNRQGIG